MEDKTLIRVFEYDTIRHGQRYGGVEFTEDHFAALVRYNEQHNNRFFTVVHRGIRFKQYVGVIQVGRLAIEILPKADREKPTDDNKKRWHQVLIEMLRACRLLRLEGSSDADLYLRNASLLDLYISLFLDEVAQIIHRGLVKKYRRVEGNRLALTGSIQFQKHVTRNIVHQERFYVNHQVYDPVHLLHQLLFEALRIIPLLSANPILADKVGRLQLSFPEMPPMTVTAATFDSLTLNRKTEHYQKAIDLARLLLLHFNPDIRTGAYHVLAILFNMNLLFEEYVYRQLRKVPGMKVHRQTVKYFWENQKIQPDIVVELGKEKVVLDTKWKILREAKPADADLKQMYAYHHYFEANRTFLVYPKVNDLMPFHGNFRKEKFTCGALFVRILDEVGRLNGGIGQDIREKLVE